jgi:predicted PurR-regulated permease PerM
VFGIEPKAARYAWTAALVLLALLTVYIIRQTLIVFVIALLLAYLLYPLMDLIDRHLPTKTRTPALAITFALTLGFIALFGLFIGSVVANEANNLATEAPKILDRLSQAPQVTSSLGGRVTGALEAQVRQHYGDIVSSVPRLTLRILSASTSLIYVVIVPILSFFILKDGRAIRDSFLDLFGSGRAAAKETLESVHTLLLQYMRALLFLCCASFIAMSIVLSTLEVPYAMLLAAIAFPLEFIPLVGPLTAAGIIIVVSVVTGYAHVWWVVAFLAIYRVFQDYVLSPHLMSQGVELHPLLIIFGVFAGGEIGGTAGVFLSIPVLALIRLLYHHGARRRNSRRAVALNV